MASYIPKGSYATFKDYGNGVGIPVEMIAFQTQPTGVFCEYAVPLDAFNQEGTGAGDQPLIQNLADAIEAVCSQVDCITGGTFVQDTDPASGLLVDFVRFYLTHTGADGVSVFSSFVDVPVNNFFTDQTGIGGLQIPSSSTFTNPSDQAGAACAALKALG